MIVLLTFDAFWSADLGYLVDNIYPLKYSTQFSLLKSGYYSILSAVPYLVTAALELHECGGDGGVLVGEVHQPRLVLDRVELEQHLLVQLYPPLQDPNQNLTIFGHYRRL